MSEEEYCRNCGLSNPADATVCANCGQPLKPNQPWFGPKRVGYGYSPRTWQGWLILIILVIVVILVTRFLIR